MIARRYEGKAEKLKESFPGCRRAMGKNPISIWMAVVLTVLLPLESHHRAIHNGSRFVKGTPMKRVSLIAWRRRERKFPETEAQRRARAREQGSDDVQPSRYLNALDALAPAATFEVPTFDENFFSCAGGASEFLRVVQSPDSSTQTPRLSEQSCVTVDLTADQSQGLRSLALLSNVREGNALPVLFELSEGRDQDRITLHFSSHPRPVSEMISTKELCRRLRVGRSTVMRLVRRGELRCYRIASRYRFAIDDVHHYLERIAYR
jgi:excisionase family DNA binding protein